MIICYYRQRDEVLEQLSALKARYNDVRQREEEMYKQVKQSVQMVSDAQLEQTQVKYWISYLLLE